MTHPDQQSSGKRLAFQAVRYIHEHSEQKFSLTEIASALYVNSYYLARVFRHETGCTMLWYHHAVRCEKAKKMLRETSFTVAEISSVTGYISPAHFSRQFKKLTGFSPTLWRTMPAESLPRENLIEFMEHM